MELINWAETRLDGGNLNVREAANFERTASGIDPEGFGLARQNGPAAGR